MDSRIYYVANIQKLFERYGSPEIIDRLKGIRKVKRINTTVAAIFENKDGAESVLVAQN